MINESALAQITERVISYPRLSVTSGLRDIECKPLLKWPGGKTSELSEITPLIPEHKRYFEPFFGGGAVYFDAISQPSHINDMHPDLMKFYKMVKTQNIEFFMRLDNFMHLWNEDNADRTAIYFNIRKRYNTTKTATIQKAVDFFILREYAYGSMFRLNSKGEFNVPFGHNYINKDIQKKIDYLSADSVFSKLKNADIYNMDYRKFLDSFRFNKNDFMFVDPPYHCSFSKYDKQDFDVNAQERLAQYLMTFKGKFMLVVQYTDLIKELYQSDRIRISLYDKKYRFNIKGRFNRSVQHALMTNYD